MQVEVDGNRHVLRPNVIFRINASLNEGETNKKGRPIYDEMEVCDVIFPVSNKYTQFTGRALDQADWYEDPLTGFRRPRTYAEKYSDEYQAFKAGTPQSLGGTPLEELPWLTEGKRLELKFGLKIYTAEQLAALDGAPLHALGPGGRDLKNRAVEWLTAAAKGNDTVMLKQELAKRDDALAALQAKVEELLKRGNAPAPAADASPAAEVIDADLAEIDGPDAFGTMTDDDIKNWLTEAGVTIDGRWGRNGLLRAAKGVLDKSGKQKQAA